MSSDLQTKWGTPERTRTTRHFHDRIRALVAERSSKLGDHWRDVVVGHDDQLLTAADLIGFEAELLADGYRFEPSATISERESPDKYRRKVAAEMATAAVDADGRLKVGSGDNLVQAAVNIRGIARFISTLDQVTDMLVDGVPPDSIAVIDDSGGTLTAPILEDFKAVICLGGTVRSHLGILTREYGIPCFMNCQIGPALKDGDAVEMEISAPAVSGSDYEAGSARRAQVWKLPA